MNWIGKMRPGAATLPAMSRSAAKAVPAKNNSANLRLSNGLKEFLWLISDVENGRLLDLGQVSQATLNFFIERGFKVTTDDFARSWLEFRRAEEERQRNLPPSDFNEPLTSEEIAEHFLNSSLQYPDEEFNAILIWDLFDHFEASMLPRIANRLHEILRPSGAVLGLFHSKPSPSLCRYRIIDAETVEIVPIAAASSSEHAFQNREILNLFSRFRSAKTFVGRDQIREGLFLK